MYRLQRSHICKQVFLKVKIFFRYFRPPYWIRHFEFSKSDNRFVISDLENLYIQTFYEILCIELHIYSYFVLGVVYPLRDNIYENTERRQLNFVIKDV